MIPEAVLPEADLMELIGRRVKAFARGECANYFRRAGYRNWLSPGGIGSR